MYIPRTLHLARIATEAVCRSYFLNGVFYWKVKQVITQCRYEKVDMNILNGQLTEHAASPRTPSIARHDGRL